MCYTAKVNAKINLCLDVKAKRPDGYHEIDSLFHSIQLSDTLSIKKANKKAIYSKNKQIPLNRNNVVLKAILTLERDVGRELNCTFSLKKNIPVSAGLGGGSANAAGALLLANKLFDLGLTIEELALTAKKVGADVPFMLYGGSCLVRGIGEKVTRSVPAPPWGLLLIKPPFGIRTKVAYELLDNESKALLHFNPLEVEKAIVSRDVDKVKKEIGNTFTEPILKKCPSLRVITDTLGEMGVEQVNLSGSGPTLYALTENCNIIEELEDRLKDKIPKWKWPENHIAGKYNRGSLIVRGKNIKPWIHFTTLSSSGWRL